jgi:hypothetical protein
MSRFIDWLRGLTEKSTTIDGTEQLHIDNSGTSNKATSKNLVSYVAKDLAQTWNAGATTFTSIKMNVTDTASASGSLLMDLQVGGSSKFKVDKTGVANSAGYTFSTNGIITDATTSRTLSAIDNGKVIYFTSSSAITVTTASGLGAGFSCSIIQGSTGQITIAQGSSTTLSSFASLVKTGGINATASFFCPVADKFILSGVLV